MEKAQMSTAPTIWLTPTEHDEMVALAKDLRDSVDYLRRICGEPSADSGISDFQQKHLRRAEALEAVLARSEVQHG
jgi:hypothetical protein